MRAVVLAGGRGTRLAPYTTVLPKPLMPVGDEPILERLIRQLARAGVDRVTLAVGHLASLIMAYFGDGSRFSVEIDYSVEEEPLGTAGPLRLVDGLDETFLVLNGDLLTDLDFGALVASHRAGEVLATVGTYRRDVQIDLGVGAADEARRITRYIEKPVHQFVVSMGVYALEPRVLDYVPEGRFDLPDLVAALLTADHVVQAFEHDGYWLDIGRPDDYERAQQDAERLG
jgi:NDP-sugar pyrophosphorylase family protein